MSGDEEDGGFAGQDGQASWPHRTTVCTCAAEKTDPMMDHTPGCTFRLMNTTRRTQRIIQAVFSCYSLT